MTLKFVTGIGFSAILVGFLQASRIAATITVPFDVVKTHQQIEFGADLFKENGKTVSVKPRTTKKIFQDIYSQHGIRGLYTGLTPRLIKVAPACAIMISSFEYGKVFFNRSVLEDYEEKLVIPNTELNGLFKFDHILAVVI